MSASVMTQGSALDAEAGLPAACGVGAIIAPSPQTARHAVPLREDVDVIGIFFVKMVAGWGLLGEV